MKNTYINPKNRVIQIDNFCMIAQSPTVKITNEESEEQLSRKQRFFDDEESASPSRKSLWD